MKLELEKNKIRICQYQRVNISIANGQRNRGKKYVDKKEREENVGKFEYKLLEKI